jgi:hypothetical protein
MVNAKHAFWQSLVLTVFIFGLGLMLGLFIENSRVDKFNILFYQSELSLTDVSTQNDLIDLTEIDCKELVNSNILFADRIYEEAISLESYSSAQKLTDELEIAHQRYDLLRTLLWINSLKLKSRCDSLPINVVYFYEFNTQDIKKKAEQSTWSKILEDLKEEHGNDILLIPIATDTGIQSLEPLIQSYGIKKYPSVLVNESEIFTEIEEADLLIDYFNR